MGQNKITEISLTDMLVRPIQIEDMESFIELAFSAQAGLTSLPKDRFLLEEKIRSSISAFNMDIKKPGGEHYIFVMENMKTSEIVGTCSIFSLIGVTEPFFTFDIKQVEKKSNEIGVNKALHLLNLNTLVNGPSEIGGLYLKPEFRKKGAGRFLSLSRFLFIALHRQRFKSKVIAEMRGVIDKDGKSPFWTHVGKTFFNMKFSDADLMSAKSKKFIADLVPRFPIYIELLPKCVQDVIGQANTLTMPALKLLETEGFGFANSVDIFDAGPKISCLTDQIRTVKSLVSLSSISLQKDPLMMMVCNNQVSGFKAICRLADLGLESQVEDCLDASVADCYGTNFFGKQKTHGETLCFTTKKNTSMTLM